MYGQRAPCQNQGPDGIGTGNNSIAFVGALGQFSPFVNGFYSCSVPRRRKFNIIERTVNHCINDRQLSVTKMITSRQQGGDYCFNIYQLSQPRVVVAKFWIPFSFANLLTKSHIPKFSHGSFFPINIVYIHHGNENFFNFLPQSLSLFNINKHINKSFLLII